jgi:uncharacterized protein (DUF1800 family)
MFGLLSALSLFILTGPAFAQLDPDPNSPEPVLLTTTDGRAIANYGPRIIDPTRPGKLEPAFDPGSTVVLYAANFTFLADEGANSLRVYGIDKNGREYRFPVLDVSETKNRGTFFAVTIKLQDEIGYWPEPDHGDLKMFLTWRGLASNKTLFGYGASGGLENVGIVAVTPSSLSKTGSRTTTKASAEYVGYRWSSDRMRFLQQATFGATPTLDDRVRRLGLRVWLNQQLDAAYPSAANPYPDIPLKNSDSANTTNGCGMFASGTPEQRICLRDHYSMYPIQTWFFREAFYGEPQLRHKVSWALSQMWVISGVDTQQSSHMIAYHKVLSQNAFGNFRTLMKAMTMNPGMGNYLDMARSTAGNPNENYPREILQLFTVGLFMLNQDGTLQLDGQGNPIPTYDQDKVNNFTKIFTGWTFCNSAPPTCPNALAGIVNYKDPMLLTNNGSNHDLTAKTLFTYPGAPFSNIAACAGCTGTTRANYANNSLDQALDNIFNHPNVGPFVSKLLIQHLVESDPTPAYVGRVAAVFNDNGQGVRGDLRAVVRAILLDPEARGDIKTDPDFGKLREPVQLMTNVLKATNVKSFDLTQNSDGSVQDLATTMAQNVFNSPTVFNYFSADYVIPGTTLLGPEFGIMTTGTAIARANFANTMVFTGLSTNENRPLGSKIDITEYQAAAAADTSGNQLLDLLNQRMMNNRMSSDMRAKLLTAVQAIASSNPTLRAQNAIYLVATSSQFQVQR